MLRADASADHADADRADAGHDDDASRAEVNHDDLNVHDGAANRGAAVNRGGLRADADGDVCLPDACLHGVSCGEVVPSGPSGLVVDGLQVAVLQDG